MSEVFVRVRSHRASDRLKRMLGVEKLDYHYNLYEGNNFALIPADRLDEARSIPGVTRARPKHERPSGRSTSPTARAIV